jgi:hypothetical protein
LFWWFLFSLVFPVFSIIQDQVAGMEKNLEPDETEDEYFRFVNSH